MLFATLNGEKIEARPNTTGICPLCERPVFSKCGEIIVWHWAHYTVKNCDDWYEPETQWHKNWKLVFGKENCEIIIKKDGVKHIADIQTNENVVIELQNSPILMQVIRDRETFYGNRMIWIINGNRFKQRFKIFLRSPGLDADEDYNRRYNPLASRYGIIDNKDFKELKFSWSRPWQSWSDVQRNVFIDFGGENLFWVKAGMGTSSGIGKKISKETFIRKYGGNLDLLSTVSALSEFDAQV